MLIVIHWDVVRLIGIIWIVLFSAVVSFVYIRDKARLVNWGKLSHFLQESVEEIENKVFSFDEALEPKFITDDKGVIAIINQAAVELFGYTKDELKGKSINIIIPEDDRAGFSRMFAVPKESRRFKVMAICKRGECPVEYVIRKKNVGYRVFFLVIMRDRTEEVRIARNLEQIIGIQKITLSVLMMGEEVGNHGSWIWDIAKDTLITSPGYRRIMGLDPKQAEFNRQFIRDKVYAKDNEIVKEALNKIFNGEPYDIIYRVMRSKDFKLVEIRSMVHPIMNDNNVLIYAHGSMIMIKEIDIVEAHGNT